MTILLQLLRKIFNKFKRLRIYIFLAPCKKFGKNIQLSFPLKFEGKKFIEIGDDVTIGAFVHIWGHGGVTIGNRVMIASHVAITSLTHNYSHKVMRFAPVIAKQIVIGDDVWIGAHAVIMPGVTIEEGAVVGAGAVVTKNVPRFAIVTGIPAKIMRYRNIGFNK